MCTLTGRSTAPFPGNLSDALDSSCGNTDANELRLQASNTNNVCTKPEFSRRNSAVFLVTLCGLRFLCVGPKAKWPLEEAASCLW